MIKEQKPVIKNKVGRKSEDAMLKKIVAIYLTTDELKSIEKMAKEDCLPTSTFLRRFIKKSFSI